MTTRVHTVTCAFRNCDPSIASRVILATVDQLCAESDIGVDILESLEFPLHEVVEALHVHELSDVSVTVEGDVLRLSLHLAVPIEPIDELFGDCDDVVRSFFDVDVSDDARIVDLTGSLR